MRVCLASFNKRFHVSGGNQSNSMAQANKFSSPIVRRAARLQCHVTNRKIREKWQHRTAGQLPVQNLRTISLYGMNLKPALGYIRPDSANVLHVDGSLS